jgi:signal transduction histidine kinase
MGAAVEWLYQQWLRRHDAGLKPDGSRFLDGAVPLTVVWTSTDERAAALVAGSAYLKSRWLEKAQEAAGGVQIALAGANETRPVLEAEASEALTIRRTAADTGLPWAVEVSLSGLPEAAEFKLRRQILLAALAAVLMLVAAGTFVIVRSRNREMALAQLQSDFVTAVSHEFRTPLTALRQFNELLIEPSALTAEAQREYHHAQSRATERLHRLVESLLDFGRMEAGKRPYKIEQVDLGLLVRDVIEEFRDELDSRIILHHSIDPGEYAVDADTEALARAIWNLLDNAVKYSGDAREVDVSVTRTGDRVAIAVRDHGIGIPLSDQRRIFQKFTRGTAAMSRIIKGTGIGLAMVQHVVSAHGGTVSVQSVDGQGSTFTIVLPALPASPAEGVGVQSAIERSAIPPASSGAKS